MAENPDNPPYPFLTFNENVEENLISMIDWTAIDRFGSVVPDNSTVEDQAPPYDFLPDPVIESQSSALPSTMEGDGSGNCWKDSGSCSQELSESVPLKNNNFEELRSEAGLMTIAPSGQGKKNYVEELEDKEMEMDNSIKHYSSGDFHSSSSECDEDGIQFVSPSTVNEEKCQVNCQVPEIGMVVPSEVEAYDLYKNYAGNKGFRVRKGKVQRLADGTIRKRYFFCSREGFRLKKQANKTTKHERKETRTGCHARIQFTIENGIWKVSDLILKHNHDLVSPSRNISDAHPIIDSVNEAGMAKEAVDAQNVGFHSVDSLDCNNFLRDKKINFLHHGDGQSLINYLNHLKGKDRSFFCKVQVDAENRITKLFWRDWRSKIDYDSFGDVLILDTTLQMDINNMICGPFVGVNHHRQHVLLGCTFLLDETTESFIWLFETFMEAMDGRQPKTIFTDECPEMANAIGKVLPETQHRLCMWLICQNATKHLSKYHRQPGFESHFNEWIFCCQSMDEFQSRWDSLLERYNLHDNLWFQSLYVLREKWSPIFCKTTFSAGIQSIRSSECMKIVFHNLTSETMTPTKFVQQYEIAAKQWRNDELYEDLHCERSEPLIILRNSLMEKQAANKYTEAVFKLFQEELLGCQALAMEEIFSGGSIARYKLTEESHRKESIVSFDCLKCTITCSCKKFESTGILCVHALKVLNAWNIFQIPTQYILKRWTKSAKDGVVDEHGEEMVDERKRRFSAHRTQLMLKASHVINKCVAIEEARTIAYEYLDMTSKRVEDVLRMKTPTNDGELRRMGKRHKKGARNIELKSCDEAGTHHQPPIVNTTTRGGTDQGSSGGLSCSNFVGGNPPKHASNYLRTQTPSNSTFHLAEVPIMPMDVQLSAPSNVPISSHYNQGQC